MDGYLAALASHDRSGLPLAANVRYTENGQALAIGDGLWGTATGVGRYRHDFADPVTGQAAAFTVVEEKAHKSILTVRLKVEKGRISEIETIVSRAPLGGGEALSDGPQRLEAMGGPEPIWSETVPAGERMSRAELQRIANAYFAGLERNDGHGFYPFADDCDRLENGYRTTNQTEHPKLPGMKEGEQPFAYELMAKGCKAQFQMGYYRFLDRIRDRRFPLIDEERGVVFSFVFFDHSGTIPTVTLTDGRTVPTGLDQPFTWELGEAFKITRSQIRRIEAAMTQAPYGMGPNWPAPGK